MSFLDYENVALKMIKHYCKNKNLSLKHFTNDIDYIGAAVEGLIKADIKYDPIHACKLSSFRYRGVVLALLSMKKRKKNIVTVPINDNTELVLEEREKYFSNCKKELAQELLEKTPLEPNQKEFIKLHFLENKTFREIGYKFLCTKQNVQQVIKRGIHQIKIFAYKNRINCEF